MRCKLLGHMWSRVEQGGGDITWNCQRCPACIVDYDPAGDKPPPRRFAYQKWVPNPHGQGLIGVIVQ